MPGEILIEQNVIRNNRSSANGGGIDADSYSSLGLQAIRIQDGNTLTGNQAGGDGGGIYIQGAAAVIDRNTITDNQAGGDGGGTRGGSTIYGNTLTGNRAGGDGGGICGGTVICGNSVSANWADGYGGGIYAIHMQELRGNEVSGNHAGQQGGGIYGYAANWERTAWLQVEPVEPLSPNPLGRWAHVPTFSPPFTHPYNAVSGNSHGVTLAAFGPGDLQRTTNGGYDVSWPVTGGKAAEAADPTVSAEPPAAVIAAKSVSLVSLAKNEDENEGPAFALSDSFSRATVSGVEEVGGLVGTCLGVAVRRCYGAGQVDAAGEPRGGLAGSIGEGALAEAAYWDREVSSLATSAIGESRTTAAMTSPHADDTYLDWDFATVWSADADGSANSGYPRLREAVVPFFGVAVMSAAPGEGSVSGQSFLPEGGLATVFALAASGHEFRHWTENGTVVSTAAEFTFAVTEARNLVAHFQEAVETVATPEFDPPGGGFATATVAVQVTCPTAGATIRYTLDGSEPTEQSIALASGGTVAVPVPGTLSARAWMDGMAPSVVRIAFYVEGFPGGDGSIRDPYQVVTRRDLEAINDDRHAHYILMNDIDLAGTTYAGAVIAGSIDTPFTGSFDGRGFALTNLRIETATRYVGLFGAVSATGRITNVHIENGSVTGARDVGALAGFSLGSITACRATGEVNGTGDRSAGGLVGWNQGTMSRCAAAVRTTGTTRVGGLVGVNLGSIDTSHAEGNVVGSGERVGGLVGSHEGALSDCYARGNANGSAVVGGLVGRNYQGKVSRCYATGRPTGASSVGGLTGSVTASGAYEDTANFWDTESSQMATSAMGTGKTTAQMRNAATFLAAGWDFDEVWAMDPTENDGYPHFHTPVPTYTITVDAQPTDGGTVQGGGTYAHGQEATVRATAGNGWVFLNWTAGGTVVSAAADFAFSVTGHRDLVAHFQEVLETVATPEFDPAGGAFPGPRVTVTVTCATDGATIRYTTSGADPTETSLTIASGGTVEVDVPGTLKAKAWMAGRVPSQVRSAFYVLGPAEGDGTAGNPYRIVTRAHLEAVNDDVAAHYVLVNDIDLAGTTYDGALIAPSSDDPFTGSLDGQGFALTGLRILSAARNVGLFGCLGATGAVRNLRLENCAITGGNGVGGLVGHNLGTVTNTRVTGTVSGTGTVDVGGLAAWNQGTLSHCSATVRTTGNDFVGGLVAYNQGTISHCDAAGDVVGLGERVGGLVGDSEGPITDSYATGNVEGSGTMVGGLVGANAGTIAEAHATGDVLGQSERVGGLVGDNGGSIADAYASGRVEGKDRLVGGLAGTNFGTIARSHATGNVTATRERVGGLVGSNGSSGTIAQTYATGEVTGGNTYAGGLVGVNFGTIADSYARGNVAAAGMLGGLLGHNQQGKLIRCYATGRPEGTFSPGGVTGAVSVGGAYEDTGNFWNTESSQIAISAMGTGKTTDQMRNAATFIAAGWDFDGVWAMDPAENDGYPHFRTSLSTYTITATAQPADGGTVQGGGTYAHGQEVTVRATAGDGWIFLNWTDGGIVVSTAAQYAFTANAPRNLVARFAVKTLPAILWNAPPPIAFGTALGPAQLSATANTDGTFTYTPPAGTVLPIGRHTLRVDFAPHDAELWSAAFAEQILDVVPNGGVPDESLATLDEGDVMAGRGWWNLTGAYAIIPVAGSSMTLRLVHDPSGRVSGVATYTVAEGTTVIMPVRGTVKGASGRVTMTCSMRGSNPARTVTVSMALVLTVDSACRKLTGPLTGSVKANGATSTVTRSLVLDLPGDMDGTWSLAFELDQAGGAVNGTALLTFSNGVSHPFSVGGRTEDDGKAVLTLAGDESDPAASRIGIRTTIAPLEDSSVRLDAFSGIGYGQILRW